MTFAEFWPCYVLEHRHPLNRALHFVCTLVTPAVVALAIVLRNPWILIAAPVGAYGLAWIGHFFVEHNRPATFKHPFLSWVADHKMFALTLAGRMGREIEKAISCSRAASSGPSTAAAP